MKIGVIQNLDNNLIYLVIISNTYIHSVPNINYTMSITLSCSVSSRDSNPKPTSNPNLV